MKCDELQYERLGDANKTYPASTLVIRKQYVDAAITELKSKLESVQASMYADVVDANMKLRKTQRALWIARATALNRIDVGEYLRKHMNSKFWNDGFHTFQEACYAMQNVINNAENACRAKAKELE